MKNNPELTSKELAIKASVAERTVHRAIEYLKVLGRIQRIGPDKGGRWQVND